MQLALTDRHIALTGAKNFRDFGGYPTADGGQIKTGLLFRSDRLSNLTEDDLSKIEPFAIPTIFISCCCLRELQFSNAKLYGNDSFDR